jgi:MFS family permease
MSTADTRGLTDRALNVPSFYPWMLIALLWVAAFLNSAGRSILITVMPQIREEFGLSATQLALINSASFWIYAVSAFVFGRLGDETHRSLVIVGGLAFWGVATGLVSLSTGFAMLIVARSLVAVGEGTYFPTGAALISDWHRTGARSRALSIHQTGVFAGAGLGALATGLIADEVGWRFPFLIFGALGLVFCLILRKHLHDAPGLQSRVRRADAAVGPGPLRTVLRRRPALHICLVFFLANGAAAGIAVWAPTFVHDELGLDLAGSAFFGSAMISLAGFLCVPIGGLLADRLAARTSLGLIYTLAIGLMFAGLLLLPLGFAGSASAVGLVLFASSAGKGLFDGCIYAAMHDVVPPAARATAVGLMTMIGFCGAGLTPVFVAEASEAFGMAMGMSSLAILYFAAVILLLTTRSSMRRAVLETRGAEGGKAA